MSQQSLKNQVIEKKILRAGMFRQLSLLMEEMKLREDRVKELEENIAKINDEINNLSYILDEIETTELIKHGL